MKNFNKHFWTIAAFGCFAFFFVATGGKTGTALRSTHYDYAPADKDGPGAAKITLLLVNPQLAKGVATYLGTWVAVKDFQKNMGTDFEELLVARGYAIRGPYESMDEAIFDDKKNSQFALKPEVDISMDFTRVNVNGNTSFASAALLGDNTKSYRFSGTIILSGKVVMNALEPLSQEKVWAPSITLPSKEVVIKSENAYTTSAMPLNDPGIFNPLTIALEEYYQEAMKVAYNKLDPRELQQYLPQVEEIRKKKTY